MLLYGKARCNVTILVTGADGYMGWPLLLRLAKRYPAEKIVGVDHGGRRRWVSEVASDSSLPIASRSNRAEAARAAGYDNIEFIDLDLMDRNHLYGLISERKPRAIVHLAAQPSAPYSQISVKHASYTQHNNTEITRNLLWALHDLNLKDTLLIVTTTTGIYGAPDLAIPEGWLTVPGWQGEPVRLPWPPMATSWYHMSRGQDALNLWLAHRQWGLSIVEIRTSIVIGSQTEETVAAPGLRTRLDVDFYFGVVAHRFTAQAVLGEGLTVYGKGLQKKPMISLDDATESLVQAVSLQPEGQYVIYNQLSEVVSITELAQQVRSLAAEKGLGVTVRHIPNPRVEREDHPMQMNADGFRKDLLPRVRYPIARAIDDLLGDLMVERERLQRLSATLKPLEQRGEGE